jgi:hypothetical protein
MNRLESISTNEQIANANVTLKLIQKISNK